MNESCPTTAIPLLLSRHASICSTPEKLEKPTPTSTPAKKQKTEEPKTDKKPEPKTAGKKNEIKARTDTDSKADKKLEQRTDEAKTEQKLDLNMKQVESEHRVLQRFEKMKRNLCLSMKKDL